MGYRVRITRRVSYERGASDIQRSEWDALIASDPELEGLADSDGSAAWRSGGARAEAVFHWDDGEIVAGSPAGPELDKLHGLARALHAIVVGESGEIYPTAGESPLYCDRATALAVLYRRGARARARAVKAGRHTLAVGDLVIRKNGLVGTIIAVDGASHGGLGCIELELEVGPRRILIAAVDHDLRRL